MNTQTATPVAPIEYADKAEVRRVFGIPPTTLYRLFNAGNIKASRIRASGKRADKRLFNCQSIRDYLASNDDTKGAQQ